MNYTANQHNGVLEPIMEMISRKQEHIKYLSAGSGGWEIWAQCEIDMVVHSAVVNGKNIEVVRSPPAYLGSNLLADLSFIPNGSEGLAVIELKCHLPNSETPKDFAERLNEDHAKMMGGGYDDFKYYSIGIYFGDLDMDFLKETPHFTWEEVGKTKINLGYACADESLRHLR
ncbi:hypothetical protein BGZ58_001703 [Dissophora ornata]|nr:hypothetical protein BGZ58_001703 [Dissophora ornata]